MLMPLARANSRWIRAVGFGILAEVVTAITIILVVAIHSVVTGGQLVDQTSRFSYLTGAVVGVLGGAFFTYLFSRWCGRYLLKNFVAHGLVIAGAAILIHVVSSLLSPQGYDFLHGVADLLKLAGGAAGGWQASQHV